MEWENECRQLTDNILTLFFVYQHNEMHCFNSPLGVLWSVRISILVTACYSTGRAADHIRKPSEKVSRAFIWLLDVVVAAVRGILGSSPTTPRPEAALLTAARASPALLACWEQMMGAENVNFFCLYKDKGKGLIMYIYGVIRLTFRTLLMLYIIYIIYQKYCQNNTLKLDVLVVCGCCITFIC